MKIFKDILLFLIAVTLSSMFAYSFGRLYSNIFNIYSSWIDASALGGVFLSYAFFLSFLFTAFGGKGKYWWLGIGLIPAVIIELYLDPYRIYFPIILALLGWLIGFGISKLLERQPKI